MNAKEKKLIKSACGTLRGSTRTNWDSGDVHVWKEHALAMRSAIHSTTGFLDTLSDDDPDNDMSEDDFLAKNS